MAKCKVCRQPYQKRSMTHKVCGPECAETYAKTLREAQERRKDRETRERIKTRQEILKEAQTAFNAFIRERDKDLPCISCGRFHDGQYHAGHYRSVGACPELRFEETNVHKQCSVCNNHRSGNILEYRLGLLARIGQLKVAWLEGQHPPVKLDKEAAKAIRDEYRAKLRELKRGQT